MEHHAIKRIYKHYSNFYDFIFKGFFQPRQERLISDLEIKPGSTVLDVGVGTGLSLGIYPRDCHVIGIDLSFAMLDQARKKIRKGQMSHISLIEMDAMNLAFNDDVFDYVVATHVISVAPDPYRLIDEMRRVCKPDGKIALVNHFVSSRPLVGTIERKFDPIFRKIGWRLDMSLDDLNRAPNIHIERSYKMNKVDLWKIVHLSNNKNGRAELEDSRKSE